MKTALVLFVVIFGGMMYLQSKRGPSGIERFQRDYKADFDANRDGILDASEQAESAQAWTALVERQAVAAAALKKKYDYDRDGTVRKSEGLEEWERETKEIRLRTEQEFMETRRRHPSVEQP